MPDSNGYPTEDELHRLRRWPYDDAQGWLAYARSLWWNADWGWPELDGEVSTGGWSGNEDILAAMQDNQVLWMRSWESARRGGHYRFKEAR